jgi:protein TonB
MRASSYLYHPSLKNRLVAIVLAAVICAAIVLMLISMGLLDAPPGGPVGKLTAISFRPQAAEKAERKPAAKAESQAPRRAAVVPIQPPTPVTPPAEIELPPNFIKLSRTDFAAADISKLGRRRPDAGGAPDAGAGAAGGPGEGPGGAKLYNAEWYREPTRAELVTYLPRRDIPGGWGMIACKTQPGNRVDDCRELAESPPGSGLARGLRQAAWQFLVRPPRIDGKPMIGVWVRIRFDLKRAEAQDAPDSGGE